MPCTHVFQTGGVIGQILRWLLCFYAASCHGHNLPHLELRPGDHVAFMGGVYVEGMREHRYLEALMRSRFRDMDLSFSYGSSSNATVELYFMQGETMVPEVLTSKNVRIAFISPLDDPVMKDALVEIATRLQCPLADLVPATQFLSRDAGASALLSDGRVTAYGHYCCAQLILHFLGFHTEAQRPEVIERNDNVVLRGLEFLPLRPPADAKPHVDFVSKSILMNGVPLLNGPVYDDAEVFRKLLQSGQNVSEEALKQAARPREEYVVPRSR